MATDATGLPAPAGRAALLGSLQLGPGWIRLDQLTLMADQIFSGVMGMSR